MTFENTLLKYRESKDGDRAMVDGINFNKIGLIETTKANSINNIKANDTKIGSSFGFGFANSPTGVGVESARFEGLNSKFNFDLPAYDKNIAQFSPTDEAFNNMKHLDAILDKPENAYCEV